MFNHKIVNTITGEEIIEPLSDAESAIIEKNAIEAAKLDAIEKAQEAKRQAALTKLEVLGLNLEDLKALGLA